MRTTNARVILLAEVGEVQEGHDVDRKLAKNAEDDVDVEDARQGTLLRELVDGLWREV